MCLARKWLLTCQLSLLLASRSVSSSQTGLQIRCPSRSALDAAFPWPGLHRQSPRCRPVWPVNTERLDAIQQASVHPIRPEVAPSSCAFSALSSVSQHRLAGSLPPGVTEQFQTLPALVFISICEWNPSAEVTRVNRPHRLDIRAERLQCGSPKQSGGNISAKDLKGIH